MRDAVIVQAVRTPIGNHGGVLKDVRPDDMAALVIKEVVNRAGVDPGEIEEVYFGCANQAGEDNRNVARMATLLAGLPPTVAAVTFNRLCASSLSAINAAARAIKCGEGDVFVAGGVESMTRSPLAMPKSAKPFPWGNVTMWDTTIGWRFPNKRLKDEFGNEGMGQTAENIYDEKPISREDQDAFSLQSHQRAAAAIDTGRFAEEIVPVSVPQRKGDPIVVDTDERPRRDSSMEALGATAPGVQEGWHGYGRQRLGHQRWRGGRAPDVRRQGGGAGPAAVGAGCRFRRGGSRAAHDGLRSHPGDAQGAGASRPGDR